MEKRWFILTWPDHPAGPTEEAAQVEAGGTLEDVLMAYADANGYPWRVQQHYNP